MNRLELDQTAASRSKRQQLDHLLTVAAPRERLAPAVAALLLAALLAWSLFGHIEHGITVDGILIKPGTRHDVVSTEPGYLLEFFAAAGDRVGVGEAIARQSVPELDRETTALRDRLELLGRDVAQAGDAASSLSVLLESGRAVLLEMEATRAVREMIVAHGAGEIMTLQVAPGDYLPAGAAVARIRSIPSDAQDGQLRAVLRVARRVAQRIQPGMQASVHVAISPGDTRELQGEVMSVSARPASAWLATPQPANANSSHRIDIALSATPGFSVPDGATCRVRIILGRAPLVALLDSGLR